MDTYMARQLILQAKITNAFKNFKSKGQDNMTKGNAQSRLKGLEDNYDSFTEIHRKIMNIVSSDPKHDDFKSNLPDLVEESYLDVRGAFNDYLNSLEEVTPSVERSDSTSGVDIEALLKLSFAQSLPQVDIPKFSGKHSEWSNFKDLFRGMIHRRDDLTPVMKLYHLKTLLTGEALDMIKSVPARDENYLEAWEVLVKYYENSRRLVDCYIDEFATVKPMKADSSTELKRLIKETSSPLNSLISLDEPVEQWGSLLVYYTVNRFSPHTRKDWARHLGKSVKRPTWAQLKDFMESEVLQLESIERGIKASRSMSSKPVPNTPNSQRKGSSQAVHALQTTSKSVNKNGKSLCTHCSQPHYISNCDKFKSKSVSERREFISKESLCLNCLGRHSLQDCYSPRRCLICKGKHHTLIHLTNESNNQAPPNSSSPSQNNATVRYDQVQSSQPTALVTKVDRPAFSRVILATARVYVESANGMRVLARALIDQCSQVSIISQSLCQRLRLKHTPIHAPITGVGIGSAVVSSETVKFIVRPRFESEFACNVDALVLPRVSAYSPPAIRGTLHLDHLEGLELADPNFADQGHIDLLLGASVHALIVEGSVIKGNVDEPIATSSLLDWIISGDVRTAVPDLSCQVAVLNSVLEPSLDELLPRFWKVEEVPCNNHYTADEQACEDHFVATHSRDESGRYVVRLPFKDYSSFSPEHFSDSYAAAYRCLVRMEAKFHKDTKLRDAYIEFMSEFENLEHMINVSKLSSPRPVSESIYLPHHGVWKESSSTTKLRTVFNGSSKTRSGLSLNDLLLAGPNLLPNLVDLICRWRNYRFVFTADVEKMYRQIRMHPDDQHFQSILWRTFPDQPVEIFHLLTVTYGVVSSTFLAQRTLKQLAKDLGSEYPLGAQILQSEIYMDDVLSGADCLQEADIKRKEITELLQAGGFPLRKWSFNSSEISKQVPSYLLATSPLTLSEDHCSLAVLGLSWCPFDDQFEFKIGTLLPTEVCTKRTVLSRISRLFDPMGWLAPVIITAKILMQSLWLLKIGWDDELPPNVIEQWEAWRSQLSSLENVKIARWTNYSPHASIIEIHGFADASKYAYAAVIYLRVVRDEQAILTLLLAKTRVVPLKTLSIPRLELCAAHLLAKLTNHLVKTITFRVDNIHLWSDSSDVLFWLKDRPSRWPVFVANRCSEILTTLPNAYWQQVRSKDNPADPASRGVEPSKFHELDLWWNGPAWLTAENGPWPASAAVSVADNPVNSSLVISTNMGEQSRGSSSPEIWDLVERYSSLSKLLRITAYCIRFVVKLIKLCSKTNTSRRHSRLLSLEFWKEGVVLSSDHPSVVEMNNAKLIWIYLHQITFFPEEFSCISSGKPLKPRSSLLKLNPILRNGLLCVGGRLRHSVLEEDSKQPLILPFGAHFTTMIIRDAHLCVLHGGVQLTLVTLRRHYWIIKGRQAVKAVIHRCTTCLRYSTVTRSQRMGDLPEARVTPSHPFSRSGVDYAGPVKVRLSKTRGNVTTKGYIAVFICLATRALHLEMVEDYTSEAFINAFHRFTARRGHCALLLSDQGTNFVGADKLLKGMFHESSKYFQTNVLALAHLGTEWKFNRPAAPHFGGIWEAAVKSAKFHLKRIVGDQVLTFVEYSTMLCRIEACLNSRLLQPLSDDPSDPQPLTPAHFLIHRNSFLVPEGDLSTAKLSLAKRWELTSQMVQHFWQRWSAEYLTSLQARNKWKTTSRSVQVNDIVLIKTDVTPPGQWPLGRVVSTHPGADGLVRVAVIKTASSVLRRPICKLIILQESED